MLLKAKEAEREQQLKQEEELMNKDHENCHEPLLNGSAKAKQANGQSKTLDVKKTSGALQPLKPEKVTVMGGDEPKKKHGCCSLM